MRKQKTIKIDDKEITVKELTVKHVLEFFRMDKNQPFLEMVNGFLPKTTTITIEELETMAPSEIAQVVDAWKEVNSSFFDLAQMMGLGEMVMDLATALKKDFLRVFFVSLKPGMAGPGATGGNTSSIA